MLCCRVIQKSTTLRSESCENTIITTPHSAPKLFAFDRRHLPFIRLSYAEIGNPAARLRFAPVKCLGRRFPNSHLWFISFVHWPMALDPGLPHSTVRSRAVRSTSIKEGQAPMGLRTLSRFRIPQVVQYATGSSICLGSSSQAPMARGEKTRCQARPCSGMNMEVSQPWHPAAHPISVSLQCVSPANDVSSARETVPP